MIELNARLMHQVGLLSSEKQNVLVNSASNLKNYCGMSLRCCSMVRTRFSKRSTRS